MWKIWKLGKAYCKSQNHLGGLSPHGCHKLLNDISQGMYFKKLVKILYNLAKPDFFEEVWITRFFALKWKADKNLWLGQNCLTNYLTSQDYNLRIIVQNYTNVEALESRFHKLSKDTKTTQRRPWLVEKVLGRKFKLHKVYDLLSNTMHGSTNRSMSYK